MCDCQEVVELKLWVTDVALPKKVTILRGHHFSSITKCPIT